MVSPQPEPAVAGHRHRVGERERARVASLGPVPCLEERLAQVHGEYL